jgi:hypothetical protein
LVEISINTFNGISMASEWFVFVFFIFSIPIYSPSLSSCTSTATVTASAASAPWCPKTQGKGNPLQCVCIGWQRKENIIKLPKQFESNGDWLCLMYLCNLINLLFLQTSSNSRNWSMSSRTAHRSRLSTQSPCAKGLRSPNDAALKDPGDQWRTSGDLKDQRPRSHSVGYIDLFCLVHLVHLRLANMHSSNFAELVGYFFGSVLSPWTKARFARFSAFSSISVRWIPLMTRPDLSASQAQFQHVSTRQCRVHMISWLVMISHCESGWPPSWSCICALS